MLSAVHLFLTTYKLAALQAVLLAMLVVTWSWHFFYLSILCGMVWFVKEFILVSEFIPVSESIPKNGLPPLGDHVGSTSESSKNNAHLPAEIIESKFGFIDGLSLAKPPSSIWVSYNNKAGRLDYASEATIVKYVSMVLDDIICAMGQAGRISLVEELHFNDHRPGIWIIHSNGLPIGIVKVKKPSDTIMNEPFLAGRVFDYLCFLESFYGIQWHFAMVTTYDQWRFFWLPGISVQIAQQTSVDDPPQSFLVKQLPDVPCWSESHPTFIDVVPQGPGVTQKPRSQVIAPRKIHGSEIFSYNSKMLPIAIASILHKMDSSPRKKVNLLDNSRAYIKMEDSWKWTRLPPALVRIKLGANVRSDATKFIFLAYLGSGAEGLVWLATTESGTGCVIKLANNIGNSVMKPVNEKTQAEKAKRKVAFDCEAKIWKTVWDIDVKVQSVGGQPALIMPYFRMCTKDELESNSEFRAAAMEAIDLMANKGYKHVDLSPRHVGLYRKPDNNTKQLRLHAVFIDLSQVCRVKAGDKSTIQEMRRELYL